MQTTISPLEQEILDLKEQVELLQLAIDRLQRQSPPGMIWIRISSKYLQSFPCASPNGAQVSIPMNRWVSFPQAWREHLLDLKKANDRNGDYRQYEIEIYPQ